MKLTSPCHTRLRTNYVGIQLHIYHPSMIYFLLSDGVVNLHRGSTREGQSGSPAIYPNLELRFNHRECFDTTCVSISLVSELSQIYAEVSLSPAEPNVSKHVKPPTPFSTECHYLVRWHTAWSERNHMVSTCLQSTSIRE